MADDGYQAGSAYVQVLPDFRGFHKKISDALKGEDATFEQFGDRAGKLFVNGFSERLRAGFEKLPKPVIKPDADTAKVNRKLDDAARDRKSTILVDVKQVGKNAGGLLGGLARSPVAWGALGAAALGPQALGLGAAGAGLGVAAGASAVGLGAFALLAKSEVSKVQASAKALATAEAAFGKATTSKQRTAALQAEAAAVKGLSPAERQLGMELTGLTSAWSGLGKAEAPVIATALAPWVSAATRGIGLLRPLVSDTGSAIGFLGQEADQAFKSPFWTVFSNSLGSAAEAGVYGFGDALGHVGDGLAHLFVDFEPDIEKLPGLIDGWSKSFDRWAQSYNKSGFEKFINGALSKSNMATLKGDLGSVATILGNVGKATASFSPSAFTGLSNVLSILAKLSPGQIEAIAAIYAYSKLTAGTSLGPGSLLGGLGGKKGAATTAEKTAAADAGKTAAKDSRIKGLGSSALGAVTAVPLVEGTLTGIPSGSGGKNWLDNPFGTTSASGWNNFGQAGRNAKNWTVNDTGNWATTGWSEAYTHFQRDFAGKITSWFTSSLPHAFTSGVPAYIWSPSYENFQRDFAGPITAWFSNSLPHFFTAGIPMGWSQSYQFFQRDFAGKITAWFTNSLPHAFDVTRHTLAVAGDNMGHWLGQGWDASGGWLVTQFGHAGSWAVRALSGAGGWLAGRGESAASGLASGWNRGRGSVTGAVGRAYGWVTGAFRGAGGWLTGAGEAIMGGFLGGLESAWHPVQSFVGGIAGWIAKNKGPLSYDAQLLTPHGEAVMGSFYSGLLRGYGPVQSLISGIAPSIAGPASLPGVGRPASGGALGLQLSWAGSNNEIINALVTGLRADIQGNAGGDVQKRLGRGPVRK